LLTEKFQLISMLSSSIVASSRISLCVFIVEDTANSGEAGIGAVVFRGDEVDSMDLSFLFSHDEMVDVGIRLF